LVSEWGGPASRARGQDERVRRARVRRQRESSLANGSLPACCEAQAIRRSVTL